MQRRRFTLLLSGKVYPSEVQSVINRLATGGYNLSTTQKDRLANKYAVFNANGGVPRSCFDASISIDSSIATVEKCWDLGSNQFDLIQATAGSRPSVIVSGLNSLPVMRFDGTDDELVGNLALNTGVFTYFIVYKYLTYTSGAKAVIANGGATGGFSYRISAGRTRNHVNNAVAAMADNITPSNFEVVSVDRSSAPLARMFVGNVAETITSPTSSYNTPVSDFRLGNRNGTAEFANVEIAETIIYDKVLTSTERTSIYNMLTAQWNV